MFASFRMLIIRAEHHTHNCPQPIELIKSVSFQCNFDCKEIADSHRQTAKQTSSAHPRRSKVLLYPGMMTSTHLWRVWFGEAPIHGPFTSPVKGIRVSFQPILCAPASYNFNTVFGHECYIQFKIISRYSLVWGTAAPLFLSMATMVCDCLCHCRVESFRCHPHFCIL